MTKFQVAVVLVVGLAVQNVLCKMDKDKMMELGKKCVEENNVPEEEVKKIMEKEKPTSPEAKCMMACIFKNLGLMTEDGMFDEEGNKKMAEEAFSGDDEKLAKANQFANMCKERVNAVEDDDKGCARAAEMHACASEKSKELGFDED